MTGSGQAAFRPNYLELPVLLLYKIDVGKTCKIFGGLGPYAAAGVGGRSTTDFLNSRTEKIVFGPKGNRPEGAYNRLDYGLAAAVGLDMRRISLAVNYSYGLAQISSNYRTADVDSFSNCSLSLTASYWLKQ